MKKSVINQRESNGEIESIKTKKWRHRGAAYRGIVMA